MNNGYWDEDPRYWSKEEMGEECPQCKKIENRLEELEAIESNYDVLYKLAEQLEQYLKEGSLSENQNKIKEELDFWRKNI